MTATVALAITSKHEGHTALRLLFNDRAYVVLSNDGRTTCINRRCIDAREPTCEHIDLVKSLTPDELEAIPHSMLHTVRADA